jgi:hypothetical protein
LNLSNFKPQEPTHQQSQGEGLAGFGAGGAGRGTSSTSAAATIVGHSPGFLLWARRFHTLQKYCKGAPPPCEESLFREGVWRRNQALIDKHNANTGSLMRKGLTRFADLSVEEFSSHHATYTPPLLTTETKGTVGRRVTTDVATSARGEGGESSPRIEMADIGAASAAGAEVLGGADENSGHRGGEVSLKAATDAAAAAGKRLPSEGGSGGGGGIFGRLFPALGASGSLTPAERARRASKRHAAKQRLKAGLDLDGPLGTGLPRYHNWGDTIDLGDIIHQGTCAGCWAYSTAAVVEAAQVIASGTQRRLSPYALIDCDNLDHGCMTGNMASAYAWIQTSQHGIPAMQHYPERHGGGGCDRVALGAAPGTRTQGYCDLPVLSRDSERQMLEALWQQPVAVGVNIHALQFYESGIVKMEDCPPADANPLKAINHAAVLTGWGFDDASKQYYWILRNTYGEHWGEKGYARLAFGQDAANFGTCALYTEGNFPLVGNLTCTPSSVRKEAVKHGKHVWLYPGGYNMGPHDAGGMNLNGAAAMLGENMQSAMLVVACGLVAASTVVMASQAVALARIARNNAVNVDTLAHSISGRRRLADGGDGGLGNSGGGEVQAEVHHAQPARGGSGGNRDPEKGERRGLRAQLLGGAGAGDGAGGRYGTSGSPLDSDTW